ncbi:hypothetical protein [Nocardia africana]
MSSNEPRDQLAALLRESWEEGGSPAETAGYLLDRGWRPPPRVIEIWAESADLPSHAIVVDAGGSVWQHIGEGWYRAGKSRSDAPEGMPHPITVLWEPEEADRG